MLDVTISWTADLLQHAAALAPTPSPSSSGGAPAIPNPADGQAPPFSNAILTLLQWGTWGALTCCVAGFIIIGARMGISHKRGEGGGHMGSMAIVGFATVLIMTSYAIVNQLAQSAGT